MDAQSVENQSSIDYSKVRDYYDRIHHSDAEVLPKVSHHLLRLASFFQPWQGKRLLDVGCGGGMWLRAAADLGAVPAGVDISPVALALCKRAVPHADLHCGPAERLPFLKGEFDFISCLGAVEHFLNPEVALREMIRVAKPEAIVLLLVPNNGFLIRRLGLYSGTQQASVREEVRSLHPSGYISASVGGICTCCRRRGFVADPGTVGRCERVKHWRCPCGRSDGNTKSIICASSKNDTLA